MFVTSVSMPAASGFIHVNKQYKKTLQLVSCGQTHSWPDPLFVQRLSIDNYKRLAARGSGIFRIAKLS